MRFPLVAGFLFLAVLAGAAQANLLTNGDFESATSPVTPSSGGLSNVSPGNVTLPGWTTALSTGGSSPGVYLASAGGAAWIPNPQSGNFCVQLDSTNSNGGFTTGCSISQTVTLAANTTYWLTFRINTECGNGKGGTSGVDLTITNPFGTKILNAVPYTATSGAPGSNPPATTPWTTWQVQFKTSLFFGGNYTFKFEDDPTLSVNSNISIDNIDLETVPEVSHWLVFVGFGACCVVLETRRRRAVAA